MTAPRHIDLTPIVRPPLLPALARFDEPAAGILGAIAFALVFAAMIGGAS